MKDVEVRPLQEIGLAHWFDIGPAPAEREAARLRLESSLKPTALRKPWRLVALYDGQVVARLAGYETPSGRFALGFPIYRTELPDCVRATLAEALVKRCIALAQADSNQKFLETKPADDVPDLELWLNVLVRMGFRETACAHLYERSLAGLPARLPNPAASLRICSGGAVPLATIRAIYTAYLAKTQDRADAEGLESPEYLWSELLEQPSVQPDLEAWRVAFLNDQPAGLVACAAAALDEGEREGWILAIGVIPVARRQQVGDALLNAALHALAERGVAKALALIDDLNTASIALHCKNGFLMQPDRYMTFRLRLAR